jgi:hypothetical protein
MCGTVKFHKWSVFAGLFSCIAMAASSFPVPVSPVIELLQLMLLHSISVKSSCMILLFSDYSSKPIHLEGFAELQQFLLSILRTEISVIVSLHPLCYR